MSIFLKSIRVLPVGLGLMALGCHDPSDRVPVYPARGQVIFQDEPAAGAFVVFHPVTSGESAPDLRPSAQVTEDGSFELTTYEGHDGAPEGDYVVTVEWRRLIPAGPEMVAGPNVIPPPYTNAETSPLKVSVVRGQNDFPPFQIRK